MHRPEFIYQSHQIQELDRIKHIIEEEIKGIPDLHVTIKDIIAEGDKVWVRLTETETHTSEFRGLRLVKRYYIRLRLFGVSSVVKLSKKKTPNPNKIKTKK